MFPCTKCGVCCKSLKSNSLYKAMDRGDGVCKYYDELENGCSIYVNRPLICRIDDMYEKAFSEKMTKEKYYAANALACYEAQNLAGIPAEQRIKLTNIDKGL